MLQATGVPANDFLILNFLYREVLADLDDYWRALSEVEGKDEAAEVQAAVVAHWRAGLTAAQRQSASTLRSRREAREAEGLLRHLPEGDLLSLIETAVAISNSPDIQASAPEAINRICDRRGVPYRISGVGAQARFEWTGDTVVSEQALEPAAAALDDPRLSDGPRAGFDAAAERMRAGTPRSRRQAVSEACNALESTMKVVCAAHGFPRPKASAKQLFDTLVDHDVVASEMLEAVLAASRFGNERGRHGDGEVTQEVSPGEAQAVIASSAVAITYLAGFLP
jgi:hypothetical protein